MKSMRDKSKGIMSNQTNLPFLSPVYTDYARCAARRWFAKAML